MFTLNHTDITGVLKDFGIFAEIKSVSELQRYHYERNDPGSKEVRLIVKVELESGVPLVVRFKNEADVTAELIESQSCFADEMRKNGIATPCQYESDGAFARWYKINGYDVIAAVEQFVENEVKVVDVVTAEGTGKLLAKMHAIAERENLHVHNEVLFDPFTRNDLFDVESFKALGSAFGGGEKALFDKIVRTYDAYMDILSPLKSEPKYAVQGDISICNLYQAGSGEIGIFDFNRCGDNNLFCDVVMQSVFEARLMDYPSDLDADREMKILTSFLRGYCSIRSFSKEQKNWYPYLYAIIDAFWSSDIKWDEGSLQNAMKKGDMKKAGEWLETIWRRLTSLQREQRFPFMV